MPHDSITWDDGGFTGAPLPKPTPKIVLVESPLDDFNNWANTPPKAALERIAREEKAEADRLARIKITEEDQSKYDELTADFEDIGTLAKPVVAKTSASDYMVQSLIPIPNKVVPTGDDLIEDSQFDPANLSKGKITSAPSQQGQTPTSHQRSYPAQPVGRRVGQTSERLGSNVSVISRISACDLTKATKLEAQLALGINALISTTEHLGGQIRHLNPFNSKDDGTAETVLSLKSEITQLRDQLLQQDAVMKKMLVELREVKSRQSDSVTARGNDNVDALLVRINSLERRMTAEEEVTKIAMVDSLKESQNNRKSAARAATPGAAPAPGVATAPAGAGAAAMRSYTEATQSAFFGRPLFAGLAPTPTSVEFQVDLEFGDRLPRTVRRRFFTHSSTCWGGG
jgi:hypothetical protein